MKFLKSSAEQLEAQIKNLPKLPGVYLFKDEQAQIIYIGKAKDLRKRVTQYLNRRGHDMKVDSIMSESVEVEHIIAKTELAAMVLEAQLVQSHQPKFNVLLKHGQPFVYILITQAKLPELKIVRNKKQKGTYFGPFLEKGPARKVFNFLQKTFRLKLCKKKISSGCLFYHMKLCAGACRPDFDKEAYADRMDLARLALKQGHAKLLKHLEGQIEEHNKSLEFEKSQELHSYLKAFASVFDALDVKAGKSSQLAKKHIWILTEARNALFVFSEQGGAVKKKHAFYFPFKVEESDDIQENTLLEYLSGFYQGNTPAPVILLNFEVQEADQRLLEKFLYTWHKLPYKVAVSRPGQGHHAALVRLGALHAQEDLNRRQSLGRSLQRLLKLPSKPSTIDCFDISHKQGRAMVGSCIRFKDGSPDKNKFRRFHIKTVHQIDDYAALREVVQRRYKDASDLPDLILIDGGKGQLNAVKDLFPEVEFASLAKREETVFSKRLPLGQKLDEKTYAGQMLIALRDYAHHFAISFHRKTDEKLPSL